MKISQKIVSAIFAAFLLTAFVPVGSAEEPAPFYFKHGAWLCTTPEGYGRAIAEQRKLGGGRTFDDLRQELLDQKECFYLEDDQRHDVVAPYISVLETTGEMKKIRFVLKFEEEVAFLHRNLNWYTFSGWTHADNLKPLW